MDRFCSEKCIQRKYSISPQFSIDNIQYMENMIKYHMYHAVCVDDHGVNQNIVTKYN